MRIALSDLAKASGGTLLRGEPGSAVDSFAIDSRKLSRGGAFFALRGDRTDGHAFLGQAERKGASVAIVANEPKQDEAAPPALILVEDTARALGLCGSWVRRERGDVQWITVTGSNGKTTTKEMIAEALSADRRVHRTPGNLNNHLGVPLTLLALPDDAQVAVVELAMSGHGEIAELTQMTDPDIGLVTNVRAVHMSSFSSLDDVAAAKGEMFAVMRDEATAVVNLDDAQLRVQSTRHVGSRVTFGQNPSAQLRLEQIDDRFVPGATLQFSHEGRSYRVPLRIGGAHSAQNALAALAVAHAAGVDLEIAAERIGKLEPGPGRGKVHTLTRGMLLIDDCYNSSPPAVAAVLETLRRSEPAGRRVLVFGDMLELGPMGAALHREAGRRAAAAGVQVLMAVGPMSRETAESARRAGVSEVHYHADSAACAEAIAEYLSDGDLILVKGSRGMRMERVVESLRTLEERG